MNTTEDIAKGDFTGRFGQEVTALFAALAFDDLLRFQLDEDLDQVIRWYTLFGGKIFRADRASFSITPGQAQHCAGGIIALHGQFHRREPKRRELADARMRVRRGWGATSRNQIPILARIVLMRLTVPTS